MSIENHLIPRPSARFETLDVNHAESISAPAERVRSQSITALKSINNERLPNRLTGAATRAAGQSPTKSCQS
jgi:hypothetical protein